MNYVQSIPASIYIQPSGITVGHRGCVGHGWPWWFSRAGWVESWSRRGDQLEWKGGEVGSFFFWMFGMLDLGAFCRWRLIFIMKDCKLKVCFLWNMLRLGFQMWDFKSRNQKNHEKTWRGGAPWEVPRVLLYVVCIFPPFRQDTSPFASPFKILGHKVGGIAQKVVKCEVPDPWRSEGITTPQSQ